MISSTARVDTIEMAVPASPRVGVFLMVNSLETGGTEKQFVTISRNLDVAKFSVELGCLKREGAFLDQVNGIEEFSPGGSMFRPKSQRSRIKLAQYLREKRIAVAHSFDFYTNLMLIPAARMARVPVVIGSHRQLGDLLTPWQFRVQNFILGWSDRVVCNSRAAGDALQKAGFNRHKLEVIPNGLPEQAFAAAEPLIERVAGVQRIGFISRMNDPGKNHELFLRVAAKLAPRFPFAQFVLAGDGPLRQPLEQLAHSLGVKRNVIFLGDRRDIPAVLASLDISVLPSRSESLSNVIIESMAAGLPVVATRVGGNGELINDEENGLLVPPGDEEALEHAIERLLNDGLLRSQMGRQAREAALASYSLKKIRDRYQELYHSLLLEKGWKPA
jgi:glycosyltransferase involved in cell wall biosynthesis